jgi:hypothetical protein
VNVATDEHLRKSLDLTGSARSLAIVLKHHDGLELRIPVENDTIFPQSVKFPRGYSLQWKGADM